VGRLLEQGKQAPEGAEAGDAQYSLWEEEFLREVDERLERYGSAFHNLAKGQAEEALSRLQAHKLKEIAAKAKGKTRKALRAKKPLRSRPRK
jgi:hypothetical protein